MKCLYDDYCDLHGTKECNQYCTKYKLIQHLLDTSMIPKNRQQIKQFKDTKVDENTHKALRSACKNIEHYIKDGQNFVLWSENTGNGKTSWAIQLMIAYFNAIWYNAGFKPRGYFIHVPTYLSRVKAAINNPDEELQEVQKNICDIDLVILDDIGTNQMTDYDISLLTHIIDQRWLNGRSTIYTTNRDRNKLRQVLGERITDRIWDSCIIHFKGTSYRGIL